MGLTGNFTSSGIMIATVLQLPQQLCRRLKAPRRQLVFFSQRGPGAPPFCATHAVSRVPFPVAVGPLSLGVASPGVLSQPPASLGRFQGRRTFVRSTIARWQEATDPQSPKGGSQRACHHGGCPPHGFWASPRGIVVSAAIPCPLERWRCLRSRTLQSLR